MFLQINQEIQKNYLLDGTTEDESIYNCICLALQKKTLSIWSVKH